MPVRFILGPAGSGKTRHCLHALQDLERRGKPAIYLVPEQASYLSEREILAAPDLPGLRHVRVFSFSRFAWWLRDLAGSPAPPAVSEAVRPMLLRAVLARQTHDALGPLAPLRGRQGFLEELSRFIGEVRNHGSVEFLTQIQREFGSAADRPHLAEGTTPPPEALRSKILALVRVFEAYDSALRDLGRVDPEQALVGVDRLIADQQPVFADVPVLVDGFLSWTRREQEILVALAKAGAPVEIALCCDSQPGRIPFLPVERTRDALEAALQRAGVVCLPVRAFPPSPGHIEGALYNSSPGVGSADIESEHFDPESRAACTTSVLLEPARNPRHEVETWARRIDRWLRSPDPTAPSKIAVILRGVEPYRELIQEIFPRYGIPFFLDERRRLLAHPRARFLLGAMEVLLSNWRRDAVIAFLRNPLLGAAPASIDLLENLSLEYGRDFEDWFAPKWEEYPVPPRTKPVAAREREADEPEEREAPEEELEAGEFDEDGEPDDVPATDGRIAYVDDLRLRLLRPLQQMQRRWGLAAEVSPGLLTGREAVAALRDLEAPFAQTGIAPLPAEEAHWDERVHTAIDALLEEMSGLWGEVAISLEEFARTLRQGLEASRLGVPPLRLEQVMIAGAQRSRLFAVERAIVGGMNDGVFPLSVGDDSVLNDRDREALARFDAALGPTATQRQEEELYLFYIAVTRASAELVLTWSLMDATGKSLAPSLLLGDLRRSVEGREAAGVAPDLEELAPEEIQTTEELGERLVSHLAQITSQESKAGTSMVNTFTSATSTAGTSTSGTPTSRALSALYNRVHLESPAPPEPPSPATTQIVPVPAPEPAARVLQQVRERILRVHSSLFYSPETHLPEDLRRLVFPPGDLLSSVSRLLEYSRCPYLSFARGQLRLVPRPRMEITPLNTGSLAHAALEKFFSGPLVTDFAAIDHRLAEIFRELGRQPQFLAFDQDPASHFRLRNTRNSLARYLRVETRRLRDNPFQIAECELPFDPDERNPVRIELPTGDDLVLRGRIDRLDRREGPDGPQGLVFDFKSSRKTGLPRTLQEGLDLQLAGYLLFVRDVLHWQPAGAFYVPVLPHPLRDEDLKDKPKNPLSLRMHGIFLAAERDLIDRESDMLVGTKGRSGQALEGADEMETLIDAGREFLARYAATQRNGWIAPVPLEDKPGKRPCEQCDYANVCRFLAGRDPVRRSPGERMVPGIMGSPAKAAPPEPGTTAAEAGV